MSVHTEYRDSESQGNTWKSIGDVARKIVEAKRDG